MNKRISAFRCAPHTVKDLSSNRPIVLTTLKKAAFTLAEVLITLGIIGVVAALTLPTLISNHKKQTYVNQLKKVVNTLENAAQMAVAQEEVSSFKDTSLYCYISNAYNCLGGYEFEGEYPEKMKSTIKEYFKTVSISSEPVNYNGVKFFDGTSANLNNYYRVNFTDGSVMLLQFNFLNMQVDINGEKGPNQYGRDFYSLHFTDSGHVKDWSCWLNPNIPESQYLENGCYYSKVVSDGWKMNY